MRSSVEESEQSEFNSAIATLIRIDMIKKGLIESTVRENINMQWRFLKAYFKELISVLSDKDEPKQIEIYRKLATMMKEYGSLKQRGAVNPMPGIIDELDNWEINLKNLEQSYGMNMPKKVDPRYAMGGR